MDRLDRIAGLDIADGPPSDAEETADEDSDESDSAVDVDAELETLRDQYGEDATDSSVSDDDDADDTGASDADGSEKSGGGDERP